MRIRTRLSKLERKADHAKTIPQRYRIAFVSAYGLNEAEVEAKVKEIEEEYLKQYGTLDGMVIFISAMPEPDPPTDPDDPNARISGTEHLL